MAIESDRVDVLGGVIEGVSTGAPIVLSIANREWPEWKRRWASGTLEPLTVPRPGHADYAGMIKYGLDDARPVLERASARETAPRVAVGALAKQLLAVFGIRVYSHVRSIGTACGGMGNASPPRSPAAEHEAAERSSVRCPDPGTAERMVAAIDDARERGESLGGVFTVTATGVPIGLGAVMQWDRRLDARLASALLSIPGVKGVEIGPAFANAGRRGTEVHDPFVPGDGSRRPQRTANRAGGIEGGMTNGEPVVVHAAMKPIPTTVAPQRSVDLRTGSPAPTVYQRSDVCAVPAASIVGEAMVAWVLAEALREKLGGDSIAEMEAHRRTGV